MSGCRKRAVTRKRGKGEDRLSKKKNNFSSGLTVFPGAHRTAQSAESGVWEVPSPTWWLPNAEIQTVRRWAIAFQLTSSVF